MLEIALGVLKGLFVIGYIYLWSLHNYGLLMFAWFI